MKESALWSLLKSNIPGHLVRVENLAGAGAPDVNACYRGSEVWLELKVGKGNWVHFRSAQLAWYTKRLAERGNVKIIMRKGDLLYVILAKTILELQDDIVPNKDGVSVRIPIDKLSGYVTTKPFPWTTIIEKVYL